MCPDLLQIKWLKQNKNTGERVCVVGGSELLVMFLTADFEGIKTNISEWHKIMLRMMAGNQQQRSTSM